jgi:hypothetical protein
MEFCGFINQKLYFIIMEALKLNIRSYALERIYDFK